MFWIHRKNHNTTYGIYCDMYVSVIGGDVSSCTEEDCRMAEEIGKGIARMGAVLVCGGRGGVMEAACKGAVSEEGTTIGILPGDSRDEGNDYLTHGLVTALGAVRNSLVVLNGDIVVAVDGGYGTLSEIALAFQYGRRVLGMGTWDIEGVESFDNVGELLEALKAV